MIIIAVVKTLQFIFCALKVLQVPGKIRYVGDKAPDRHIMITVGPEGIRSYLQFLSRSVDIGR